MSTALIQHLTGVLVFSAVCPLLVELFTHAEAGHHTKIAANTSLAGVFSALQTARGENATLDGLIGMFLLCVTFSQGFRSLLTQLEIPPALGRLFPYGLGAPQPVDLGNDNDPDLTAAARSSVPDSRPRVRAVGPRTNSPSRAATPGPENRSTQTAQEHPDDCPWCAPPASPENLPGH
ncbi:hypothetical protein KIH74_34640 [Kineosporia sp. J2-2]|uniref:Uncharacterized protein n=1 Tax=Kineosporia corallincola TaxID=2835133 RepID=A0ABS5TTL7_9ACTN|nr:hypothetical protein [Kineosporia corallincola]MBT0774135.1 hypothetical protein [Kineosporia corallincola]